MLTILLFGSLIIPFLGVVTWIHLKEATIKKTVKDQLARGSHTQLLTVLCVAKSELHLLDWEHDQEFEYQHVMYDVVRQEETEDSMTYYCVADQEESQLKAAVAKLLARAAGHPLENNRQSRLSIFLRALVCPGTQNYTGSFMHLPTKMPTIMQQVYGRIAAAPPAPPPKRS